MGFHQLKCCWLQLTTWGSVLVPFFSQSNDLPCCWPDLFYLCRASSFFEAVWKCVVGHCILLFCSSDTELLAAISSFNNNNYNHNAPTLNCSNNEIIIAKVWMKLEIHYLVWTGRKILPSNYALNDYLLKFEVQYENFTCSWLSKIIAMSKMDGYINECEA